jgi:hypothetical protein
MEKQTQTSQLPQDAVNSSSSRFMENFFEDGEFYTDLEDFIYKVFDGEEEKVRELKEDAVFECKGSILEPIIDFSSQWITERIDDDRFSENDSDDEYEKITKVLEENIDFKKITDLLPKLYYENYKDKFTITKQDLLDAL